MKHPTPIADAIDIVATRLVATAEQAWAEIKSKTCHGRLSLAGIDEKARLCPVEPHWLSYIERWGPDGSDMPGRESGSMIAFDRERASRDRRADARDGRTLRSVPPIRLRDVVAEGEQLDVLWPPGDHELPYAFASALVPLGLVADRDNCKMEIIDGAWQAGKITLWGRRKGHAVPEPIRQYHGLVIQWMGGAPKGDYYAEAYAHPKEFGAGYHKHEWEDLAIPRGDLEQLPNPFTSLRDTIAAAHEWHRQTVPDDQGELRRIPEALAQLRKTACEAFEKRQAPDITADIVEAGCDRIRDHIFRDLLHWLARGEFAAVLETVYGREVMSKGPYWLRPDGTPTPQAQRALITGTAQTVHNGSCVAGTVKARPADFERFSEWCLTYLGLVEVAPAAAADSPSPVDQADEAQPVIDPAEQGRLDGRGSDALQTPMIVLSPGPKGGEQSVSREAWQIAESLLACGQGHPRRHGRLMGLARQVNGQLAQRGHIRQDDSVRKAIGPSLRDWERKNPDK